MGLLGMRSNARPVPRPRVGLAEEGRMTVEGILMLILLAAGLVGGIVAWTRWGPGSGRAE
jgi:hypothetical protein